MANLGNLVDVIGTKLNLPELGLSEKLSGSPTVNTYNYQYANGYNPYAWTPPSFKTTGTATPNGTSTQYNKVNPDGSLTAISGDVKRNAGSGDGGYTADQALKLGLDINKLRSSGQLIESAGPNVDAVRNDISSGYDSYFSQLDKLLGLLPDQKSNLEGIANNNYDSNMADLQSQFNQGKIDLNTTRDKTTANQEKNLRSLSENLRNEMLAGNIYLGGRGAGDSSAGNQYSYAIAKMGNKERGNIMSDTAMTMADLDSREAKLTDIFNTESKKSKDARDNAVLQIAQWFNDQQNNILQMKANGQLQKGQDLASLSKDLLNNALGQISTANANYQNQLSSLQQWAMNNSKTIADLRTNMSAVSTVAAPNTTYNPITGTPQVDSTGGFTVPFGIGSTTDKEKQTSAFG